ncbi:hypothetical protein K466DRAFT_483559 [Polyporus arcularius HHB13444]|uniref:DUF7918 domain-containing protein n=1 Tax=Polyporus arcularius HHB13444 TaxID=1314778 RepID=A0A5C3PRM3_9APHY|nr:hypothetical protein K466DRAFT_483559 [Polyporus arcularius HHB13444]
MPLKLNGYTAHVCSDGKELEAHGLQAEGGNAVSCWIASESGKEFTVHWGDDTATATLQVLISMDGRICERRAHEKTATGTTYGVEETPGQRRPYQFAPLVLTDDEGVASSKAALSEKLGVLEVVMRSVDRYVENETYYSVGKVSRIGPAHEKSKKAGAHAVSFGDIKAAAPQKSLSTRGLKEEPVAIFRFRYRPLALLQANGIAPLPPKAARGKKRPLDAGEPAAAGPSNSKRPRPATSDEESSGSDDDDADRVTFLREQIVMLQDQLEREQAKKSKDADKREASPIRLPDGDDDIIDLTVKREASPIMVPNGADDDIIDLT